jgi:hypothetical protein
MQPHALAARFAAGPALMIQRLGAPVTVTVAGDLTTPSASVNSKCLIQPLNADEVSAMQLEGVFNADQTDAYRFVFAAGVAVHENDLITCQPNPAAPVVMYRVLRVPAQSLAGGAVLQHPVGIREKEAS